MKTCLKCKIEKELTEFTTDNSRKDSLDVYCRSCRRKHYIDPYRQSSKGKTTQRRYHLKRTYGVDLDAIPEVCELCGRVGKICVDHDHQTGEVRGFLCNSCNAGIGYSGEDPELMRRWADYIEKKR